MMLNNIDNYILY